MHHSVLRMGGLVQQQLYDAINALIEPDAFKAERVMQADRQVNSMEMSIDEHCRQIIVRRQPSAGDLRLVLASIKTIADLERIGDEAKRIARMAEHHTLNIDSAMAHLPVDIAPLAEQVHMLLHRSLDTFARMDADTAWNILCCEDMPVDEEYNSISRQLINTMMSTPRIVPLALDILWSARSLERIGDRACNICEYVVYCVHGRDVRYRNSRNLSEDGAMPLAHSG